MSNRINRTLSANSNRLNLGSRSLALVNDANNDKATLRSRHHVHPVYPVVPVRVGFTSDPKKETPAMKRFTSIPMSMISTSIRGTGFTGEEPGLESWESGSTLWLTWTSLTDAPSTTAQGCFVVAEAPPLPPSVVTTDDRPQARKPRAQQPLPATATSQAVAFQAGRPAAHSRIQVDARIRACRLDAKSRTASVRGSLSLGQFGKNDKPLTSAAASS